MKCQTDDIYFMTQTELQLFIDKKRYEFLERWVTFWLIFTLTDLNWKYLDHMQDTQVTVIVKVKNFPIHMTTVKKFLAIVFALEMLLVSLLSQMRPHKNL